MVEHGAVREQMQVLGSDGGMVGVVERIEEDGIVIRNTAEPDHLELHHVPLTWIARVDDHVHLNRQAALVRHEWTAAAAGAPPGHTALGTGSLVDGAGTTTVTGTGGDSPEASVATGAVPETHRPAPQTSTSSTSPAEADAFTGMGRSWIVWLIGAVMLLIIVILGIRGCGYAASDTDYETEPPPVDAPAA